MRSDPPPLQRVRERPRHSPRAKPPLGEGDSPCLRFTTAVDHDTMAASETTPRCSPQLISRRRFQLRALEPYARSPQIIPGAIRWSPMCLENVFRAAEPRKRLVLCVPSDCRDTKFLHP